MLYEYRCPGCGWHGDKVSSIAERDNQHCQQEARPDSPESTAMCGVKLIREEISVTARMSYAWNDRYQVDKMGGKG